METPHEQTRETTPAPGTAPATPANDAARDATAPATPHPAGEPIALAGDLPGERVARGESCAVAAFVRNSQVAPRPITLTRKLAEGGEGSVFATSIPGHVAKIYRRERLTPERRAKLELMCSMPVSHPGVCFPRMLVENERGEFVGFLMRQASGYELGRSVFVKKLLQERFPSWTKRDTVQLCITILEKITYLNDAGIILGDINPQNILVESPTQVYFVDCDSYQVGSHPCPVGTVNFTPPEAQGRDYKTFLRTQEMENFAIATLLFMIMLPGKTPYSIVGGESQAKNILAGDFPYPHSDSDGSKIPRGAWGFIWSQMSYNVREAFFQTFQRGEAHFAPADRLGPHEWLDLFEAYRHGLDFMARNDPQALDIFPTHLKMRECKHEGCTRRYIPDPDNYSPYCEQHTNGGVWKRKRCKNPTCRHTVIVYNNDRGKREPEYCAACWEKQPCARCGSHYAKWMLDEHAGLCASCARAAQRAADEEALAAAANVVPAGGGPAHQFVTAPPVPIAHGPHTVPAGTAAGAAAGAAGASKAAGAGATAAQGGLGTVPSPPPVSARREARAASGSDGKGTVPKPPSHVVDAPHQPETASRRPGQHEGPPIVAAQDSRGSAQDDNKRTVQSDTKDAGRVFSKNASRNDKERTATPEETPSRRIPFSPKELKVGAGIVAGLAAVVVLAFALSGPSQQAHVTPAELAPEQAQPTAGEPDAKDASQAAPSEPVTDLSTAAPADEDPSPIDTQSPADPEAEEPAYPVAGVAPQDDFNTYSWTDLSTVAQAIAACETREEAAALGAQYGICDEAGMPLSSAVKLIEMPDGAQVGFAVVDLYREQRADTDGRAGLVFMANSAVAMGAVNAIGVNFGGWAASDLRGWLNNGFLAEYLPPDLRAAIVPVLKSTGTGSSFDPITGSVADPVAASTDYVWLPSFVEVAGRITGADLAEMDADVAYTLAAESTAEGQLAAFAAQGIRPLEPNGPLMATYVGASGATSPTWWWLRSPFPGSDEFYLCVDELGNPSRYDDSSLNYGVLPAFCL